MKFNKVTGFSVLTVICVLCVLDAHAAGSTGQALNETSDVIDSFAEDLYCAVRDVIIGPIGTTVGILVSIMGLYQYLLKKSNYGLYFFIAGVALTGLPGIFNWYASGVQAGFGGSFDAIKTCPDSTSVSETQTTVRTEKDVDALADQGYGLQSLVSGTSPGNGARESKTINFSAGEATAGEVFRFK